MIIKLEKKLNKQESASYQVLQTLDKMPFVVILDNLYSLKNFFKPCQSNLQIQNSVLS